MLPFRIPIKEIENIDFINEENTFMKFIHSEHNILENDNIKRERQSYIEITSVIIKGNKYLNVINFPFPLSLKTLFLYISLFNILNSKFILFFFSY